MHRFACRLISSALLFASLVTPVSVRAAVADTTTTRRVTTQAHGSIALASFRIGARLASFLPIGSLSRLESPSFPVAAPVIHFA